MKPGRVYLDRRVGARKGQTQQDALDRFAARLRTHGLHVQPMTLPFGDVAWLGRGERGQRPVRVGVEIKTLGDLLQSVRSGRLTDHQLPGLRRSYDVVWLIIEGVYRIDPAGDVAIRSGKGWTARWFGRTGLRWRALAGMQTSLEVRGGVYTRRTLSPWETAWTLAELYHWWTSKDLDQHRTVRTLHCLDLRDRSLLGGPVDLDYHRRRQVAAALPGVGLGRSEAVAKHFSSIAAMALAGVKEWGQIEGIGRALSTRIVQALQQEGQAIQQEGHAP